jgi:polysaccharide export outer membrane protein
MEQGDNAVQLCQATMPINGNSPSMPPATQCASGRCGGSPGEGYTGSCGGNQLVPGVDCNAGCGCPDWSNLGSTQLNQFGPGEYVIRARQSHVGEYRLRVDDEIDFVYTIFRRYTGRPYVMQIGDEVKIESLTNKDLDQTLLVQPDGTITLRGVGQLIVARKTVEQIRGEIEQVYLKTYKVPAITVSPTKVNTRLEDIRLSVYSTVGNGQTKRSKVTPEGTVALPVIGSICAQGLTLDELKREVEERYKREVDGLEITPILANRAPRVVYVAGEIARPNQYVLSGPTTVMQAITLAGGWNTGANIKEVVVMRRTDDWQLVATVLDLRQALLGKQPCPSGEIWVADNDLIIIPKSKLLLADNFVDMTFTRLIYKVFPFTTSLSFTNLSAVR